MKFPRVIWRLTRAVGHALNGYWIIRTTFPRTPPRMRELAVQAWARKMLEICGIRLVVHGNPPARGPMLLVCNHISWLDILVMHAAGYCRFVSKSGVRHWPLIGVLSTGAGSLYIERESRRDAMRVVHHMAEGLRASDVFAIFPEGTTSDGRQVLPFHANLIQAAISAGAPVQPMALRFIDRVSGEPSTGPSYTGDETLIGSLWRTLGARPIAAHVRFGVPQHCDGRDRRAWARDLRAAVEALWQEPMPAA